MNELTKIDRIFIAIVATGILILTIKAILSC